MDGSFWSKNLLPGFPLTGRGQTMPVHAPKVVSSEIPVAVRGQTEPVHAPKVVSIPVHFVGSERSRSDSAVKIQKVVRGFLVRKCMKKIATIRNEVNEIEERIAEKETVDLIRRDPKERLKVIETLMSLLFRLDSVRGVDSGVRDFRKAVIKKAIALQELVDGIVVGNQTLESDNVAVSESVEHNQAGEIGENAVDQTLESQDNSDIIKPLADSAGNCDSCPINGAGAEPVPIMSELEVTPDELTTDNNGQNQETVDMIEEILEDHECQEEIVGISQTESQSDSSMNPQTLAEGGDSGEGGNFASNVTLEADDLAKEEVIVKGNCGVGSGRGEEENKRSRELLERMMEDNEKMMGMMAQLFERNEKQTRLLSSLSQRVELLEKAFLCEKLRRKKRNAASAASDVVERSPDTRKSGKR
ncbi:hypothetical protein SLE2022_048520 [Rubroshorea leprosula]